jgi:hypothetical protein
MAGVLPVTKGYRSFDPAAKHPDAGAAPTDSFLPKSLNPIQVADSVLTILAAYKPEIPPFIRLFFPLTNDFRIRQTIS